MILSPYPCITLSNQQHGKHASITNLFIANHSSKLIIKNGNLIFRISTLINPLRFMGDMKQLSIAIDAEGKQNCYYQLANKYGSEWILNCTLKQGVIALEIWFLEWSFSEKLASVFSWKGLGAEFREGIDNMILNASRYNFFKAG